MKRKDFSRAKRFLKPVVIESGRIAFPLNAGLMHDAVNLIRGDSDTNSSSSCIQHLTSKLKKERKKERGD